MHKFVACCSTVPSRVARLQWSVDSLLSQTNRVERLYVHYPWHCDRLNQPYPYPPDWMQNDARIKVVRCDDFGPATKFLPALDEFDRGDSIALVLFDDDRVIPLGWIEPMLDLFEQLGGASAVGRHGTLRHSRPFSFSQYYSGKPGNFVKVSYMSTSWIAIYPRCALPASATLARQHIRSFDPESRTNDDMMLSSFCHISGTARHLLATSKSQREEWEQRNPESDDEVSLAQTPVQVKNQVKLYLRLLRAGAAPLPRIELLALLGAVISLAITVGIALTE